MTCRGYDAKAVKVGKSVKRTAANYADPHRRGAHIRSYVKILEDAGRQRNRKSDDKS
jgi:hypothetical protein